MACERRPLRLCLLVFLGLIGTASCARKNTQEVYKHESVDMSPGSATPQHHSDEVEDGRARSIPLKALVLSTASGLSLPIGALLGVAIPSVKNSVCAGMLAFGAGSLLFAVTVELYGHALRKLDEDKMDHIQILASICGAIFGALFYLCINRCLEGEEGQHGHEIESVETARKEVSQAARKEVTFKDGGTSFQVSKDVSRKSFASSRTTFVGVEVSNTLPEDVDAVRAKQVALALFVGLLVDGIPEGILMGFLAAEDHLTPVFVISLFIANFPEAFASASLLKQAKMGIASIAMMWTGLCLLIGFLAFGSCGVLLTIYPNYGPGAHLPTAVLVSIALVEGLTGGAMIACISSVMLPEAFERAGKHGKLIASSGFLCTCGFLLAVGLKAMEKLSLSH